MGIGQHIILLNSCGLIRRLYLTIINKEQMSAKLVLSFPSYQSLRIKSGGSTSPAIWHDTTRSGPLGFYVFDKNAFCGFS